MKITLPDDCMGTSRALDAAIGIVREKPDVAKIIGVGGIFFRSKDPAALINW